MIDAVRVRVPGKVNLILKVGASDEHGFHELGTVFQAVCLDDEILVRRAPAGRFDLRIQGEGASFLPVDDTNLAVKAARLLASHSGRDDVGVSISIRKRIPVAGGMAGGSANAAGVLVGCNELWGGAFTLNELHPLAASLGSDVPFLLYGGTAVGSGRGERLTPVTTGGLYHWVFALAHSGLSTPAVFRRFDTLGPPRETGLPGEFLEALGAGDLRRVGQGLTNDLQEAAISLHPPLAHVLALGLRAGALGAVVSGSGPTCAFLTDSEAHGLEVAEELRLFSGVRSVRCAHGPVAGAQIVSVTEMGGIKESR